MRSERWRLLGGNLLTSLSTALGQSPYNQCPKTWDDYLKLLMQAYKVLHLDKAQGTIFSPEANVEKSRGKKDPDAIEIDEIHKKEGKNL